MDGFVIRAAVDSDLPALTALYNHYIEHTAITFDTELYTVEQRREWFSHYYPTGRHRLLVAEENGQVLGYASSGKFRPRAAYDTSVETSVYVDPKAHGRGIGTTLYTALFEILATEDVHRAIAGITLPNEKSIALHEKFGFLVTGVMTEVGRKFDCYWDVAWLEKRVEEATIPLEMVAYRDKELGAFVVAPFTKQYASTPSEWTMYTHGILTNLTPERSLGFDAIAITEKHLSNPVRMSDLTERLDQAIRKLQSYPREQALAARLKAEREQILAQWFYGLAQE